MSRIRKQYKLQTTCWRRPLTLSAKLAFLFCTGLVEARHFQLKESYESDKANICLIELISPQEKLSPEEEKKLKNFCAIPNPLIEKNYEPQELEIFFYQAGFFPVSLRQKVRLKPLVRELTVEEKRSLGLDEKESVILPKQAPYFLKENQLFLQGQKGEMLPYRRIARFEKSQKSAGSEVTYILATRNFLFTAPGKLNHRASIGSRVSVKVLGRNLSGILVNETTVEALP